MSVGVANFVWQQGEDGNIGLNYKQGADAETAVPVDLTGYALRMDVRVPGGSTALYTFNTNDSDSATVDEAVLGSNGSISITVPRSVSLPTGPLASYVGQTLVYDIFLRDTSNRQKKILKGTITYEASTTLWT